MLPQNAWQCVALKRRAAVRRQLRRAVGAAEAAEGLAARRHEDHLLVLKGTLDIELRDRTITLNPGEIFVVPTGVEHRPVARGEVHIC